MRHAFLAFLLALVLPLAACNSTVEGTARKGSADPPRPAIAFDQLDPGPYPTTASQPLGVAGDPLRGIVVEAQRMANNVVGPWEIDPAVNAWFAFGAVTLPNVDSLSQIAPGRIAAAAGRHDYINGFASARAEEGSKRLVNAVLRFADETSATDAANDLGATALQEQGVDGPAVAHPIAGHPEAQASTYTILEGESNRWHAVRSFTAHGPYVLMQLAQSTENVDQAAQMVAKSIDLQSPEIDRFRATDPAEFADITVDPTGLLARTIPAESSDQAFTTNTTYEARGALHFQNDPPRTSKLFVDSGTEVVSVARTNVYETRDADGAKRVVDGFFAELDPIAEPTNAVQNMPDSKCLRMDVGSFYCLAAADKYAIEVQGANLLETQQLVAAQYIMLMS